MVIIFQDWMVNVCDKKVHPYTVFILNHRSNSTFTSSNKNLQMRRYFQVFKLLKIVVCQMYSLYWEN